MTKKYRGSYVFENGMGKLLNRGVLLVICHQPFGIVFIHHTAPQKVPAAFMPMGLFVGSLRITLFGINARLPVGMAGTAEFSFVIGHCLLDE